MTEKQIPQSEPGLFDNVILLIGDTFSTFFGQGFEKGFQIIFSGVIGTIAAVLVYFVFAEKILSLVVGMLVAGFAFGFLDRSKSDGATTN